jgi:hypothetical protein
MRHLTLIIAFVAACGAEAPPQTIDASTEIDAASLPACTGAAYESCTENSHCASQNCRLFMGQGIQICTQNCDVANPCPDFDGVTVPCNNMGRCDPKMEHVCMR